MWFADILPLHYPLGICLEGNYKPLLGTKPFYSRESLSSLSPKQPEHRKNPSPVVTWTPGKMLSRHALREPHT